MSRTYLECPCCGDDGAESDEAGYFHDGQSLICGCPGWVSVDSEGDEEPSINNGDESCAKCARAQDPDGFIFPALLFGLALLSLILLLERCGVGR